MEKLKYFLRGKFNNQIIIIYSPLLLRDINYLIYYIIKNITFILNLKQKFVGIHLINVIKE